MSEMKLCPFCGWEFAEHAWNEFGEEYRVCDQCGATSGTVNSMWDWNNRPIEDALNASIAELEEARRWIPVSERLPEVGKVVHVIDMNDIGSHLCNLYETAVLVEVSGNKRFGFIGHSGWDTSDVTHWMYAMPLPEPPEVKE